jgi:tetratricopeptide (TPR) repeat protein
MEPYITDLHRLLARQNFKVEKVLESYEKGVAIGRKKFGGNFLKENKGIFWGLHETRPFMRCLYRKAEILIVLEKIAEGVAIMEELIELNEGDNQGVRYPLLSALITLGETKKFKKYDKMFAEDNYSTQMFYSRALFAFQTEGNSANACKRLKQAFEENPFVVQKLFDENFQLTGVGSYSPGSPEEAEIYLAHAFFPWHRTEGAAEWLMNTLGEEDYLEKVAEKRKNRDV